MTKRASSHKLESTAYWIPRELLPHRWISLIPKRQENQKGRKKKSWASSSLLMAGFRRLQFMLLKFRSPINHLKDRRKRLFPTISTRWTLFCFKRIPTISPSTRGRKAPRAYQTRWNFPRLHIFITKIKMAFSLGRGSRSQDKAQNWRSFKERRSFRSRAHQALDWETLLNIDFNRDLRTTLIEK